MSYQNKIRKNKDNAKSSKKSIAKNEKIEDESAKNDDSTSFSSSSSLKKYGKKNKRNDLKFSDINYSINDNPVTNKKNKENQKNELSSIIEEKNSNSKKDEDENEYQNQNNKKSDYNEESFCLLEENKNKTKKKEKDKESDKKNNDIDESINNIINKKFQNKKLTKNTNKKKEEDKENERIINISDNENENEDENNETIILSEDDDNYSKKRKKYGHPKKEAFSKLTSKSKINLAFLDIEEKKKESENDFKYYIQKPFDEEEEYKIIYEFNNLPFKPKIFTIDLSVFDDESIFKCISYCYFNKSNQNFILELFFVYLSKKSELYNNKNCEEEIMKFFLEKKEQIEDGNKKDEENNKNNENYYDLDNNIKLKLFLKKV
jgi:hypothetical protein